MKKKPYSVQMNRDDARPTFGKRSPVMAKSEPDQESRRKKGRSASRRQKIAIILSKARKGK